MLVRMRNYYVYYVYIMSNRTHVLYIGVTNDLYRRVEEHRAGTLGGFTSKYKLRRLVYFEHTNDVRGAIEREKQLKNWRREKKIALIERMNPTWSDLSRELFDEIDIDDAPVAEDPGTSLRGGPSTRQPRSG
jgi:putative endonuclease